MYFQSIRSKMSIRAEDKPKAFEAHFLSTTGKASKYGDFDFQPGAIVRKEKNEYKIETTDSIGTSILF